MLKRQLHAFTMCTALLLGCNSTPPENRVRFLVDNELVPAAVRIQGEVASGSSQSFELELTDGNPEDLGITLVPGDGENSSSYRIAARALSRLGRVLGETASIGDYGADDEVRELTLNFDRACERVRCLAEERCGVGQCEFACDAADASRCVDPYVRIFVDSTTGEDRPPDPLGDCTDSTRPCQTLAFALSAYAGDQRVFEVAGVSGTANYPPLSIDVLPNGTRTVIRARPGTGRPTLLGAANETVFAVSAGEIHALVLDGFTLRGGARAVELQTSASVELRNLIVSGNEVQDGDAAVRIASSDDVQMRDVRIFGNGSGATTGIVVSASTLNIERSVISGHGVGQVLCESGRLNVRDTLLSGGAVGIESAGDVALSNSRLCDHREAALRVTEATAEVDHSTFFLNGDGVVLNSPAGGRVTDSVLVGHSGRALVADGVGQAPSLRSNYLASNAMDRVGVVSENPRSSPDPVEVFGVSPSAEQCGALVVLNGTEPGTWDAAGGAVGAEEILAAVFDFGQRLPNDLVFEAETLLLNQFTVSANSAASNGRWIQTQPGATGTATLQFNGDPGRYTVTVIYFDENDGESAARLLVNDVEVDRWTWSADLGSSIASLETRTERQVSDVTLDRGDEVTLEVEARGNELARVDVIVIDNTTDTPPLQNPILVEVESLPLTGFIAEESGVASGNTWIQLGDGLGTVTYTHAQPSGVFDLETYYFDENDGVSLMQIAVDGMTIDSWSWDQELGSSQANGATATSRVTPRVSLEMGDTLVYSATSDGGERTRFDYFILRPVQ
ncbi:MAG: hypothetical protein AAF654_00590 [Myxococcota bacterium]